MEFITQYIDPKFVDIFYALARSIIYVLIAIVFSAFYKKFIKKIFRIHTASNRKKTIAKLTISIGRYVIWFVILLLVLEAFQVKTGPILASAGVVGIAFGLGAQGMINDFLSGFFILFEESFEVGDVVEIDGFTGEVIDIGLRTTKIRNWQGVMKVINNGDIATLLNKTRYNTLAIVDLSVAYESNMDQVAEILTKFASEYKNELCTEPAQYLGVMNLNESGVDVRLVARCLPNQHHSVEREIRAKVKTYLEEQGITIPFPQITINQK